jgi:SAM-dependent methyltransferase
MEQEVEKFERYFRHLSRISLLGRVYKRLFAAPIVFLHARRFGRRVMEVGFGSGSSVLGTFPKHVSGLEINPVAVAFCRSLGMKVQAIAEDGSFPETNASFDVCVMDNVLEHIESPQKTLDECHRITGPAGGLVIVVPGVHGYAIDGDHKKFYDSVDLERLDPRWRLRNIFSLPFGVVSPTLSRHLKQYCLVAVYVKRAA